MTQSYGSIPSLSAARSSRQPLALIAVAVFLGIVSTALVAIATQSDATVELSARFDQLSLIDTEDRIIADAYGLVYTDKPDPATIVPVSPHHEYPTYVASNPRQGREENPDVPLMEDQTVGQYTYRIDPATRMEAEANIMSQLPIQGDPNDVAQQALKIAMAAAGQDPAATTPETTSPAETEVADTPEATEAPTPAPETPTAAPAAPAPATPNIQNDDSSIPSAGGVGGTLSRNSGTVTHSNPDEDFFGDDILKIFSFLDQPKAVAPSQAPTAAPAPKVAAPAPPAPKAAAPAPAPPAPKAAAPAGKPADDFFGDAFIPATQDNIPFGW